MLKGASSFSLPRKRRTQSLLAIGSPEITAKAYDEADGKVVHIHRATRLVALGFTSAWRRLAMNVSATSSRRI